MKNQINTHTHQLWVSTNVPGVLACAECGHEEDCRTGSFPDPDLPPDVTSNDVYSDPARWGERFDSGAKPLTADEEDRLRDYYDSFVVDSLGRPICRLDQILATLDAARAHTGSEREAGLDEPCMFVPANEPWSCSTHVGGVRTSLHETVCRRVQPARLVARDEPIECTEDEYDALARQLHESIAEGQTIVETAKALRILAAPTGATPDPHGEDLRDILHTNFCPIDVGHAAGDICWRIADGIAARYAAPTGASPETLRLYGLDIQQIKKAIDVADYWQPHWREKSTQPDENCFSLPDGTCIGVDCIHDVRET